MTRASATSRKRWLRGADPSTGRPRIVCCPHSGGTAVYFRSWQELAPAGVSVLSVQYPGRHDRLAEPYADSIEQIAAALAEEIGRHPAPTVLFGHSMGSSVAYETARLLRLAGVPLDGLVVSAHTPPDVPVDSDIHLLPDAEMWQELTKLGGTEPEILEMVDLREIFTPLVRSDLALDATYLRPAARRSLDVPVVAIAGNQDAVAPPSDVRAWSGVTTGRFEMHTFDGDHFYLQQHAAEVVALAVGLLAGASADTGAQPPESGSTDRGKR
ncbi:thioesterase II family protein [Micromonospora sp. DT31]|uniref:thioesterase II family protein n=1 Tax=Micromonospora sp. DT31 TaxID=3393434 RepID=UPI003CF55982